MKTTFIYKDDIYIAEREKIASYVCYEIAKILRLPDEIQIEFAETGDLIYGETFVDPRFKNRIRIKSTVEPVEMIQILTHELIHVHQTHVGRLQALPHNIFIWDNKQYVFDTRSLTFEEQQKLPWEIDVVNKQQNILRELLRLR